ncbi:MAG: ABC transporter substrate-binding protein [Actinomycetes bacterium]
MTPDFEDLPIWVAIEKGYYREAGLDVRVIYPPSTTTAPKLIATDTANIGYVETPGVLEAVQQHAPIKVIAGVWQKNAQALVGKPGTKIDPTKFAGKTFVTFAGPGNVASMNEILHYAGLKMSDIKVIIAQSSNINLMLAGKANYALNAAPYGIAEVEAATGKLPALLMTSAMGLRQYPQTAYAGNTTWMAKHPNATRKWVAATLKAVQYAVANPAAAVSLYVKATGNAGGGQAYSSAGWGGVIPLLNGPNGLFRMNNNQWTTLEAALTAGGAFSGSVPPSSVYTNEYIPQ